MIKNREREIEAQPIAEESQIDFEALYYSAQKEKESVQAELEKVIQDGNLAKESWATERDNLSQVMHACEESVSVWRKEIHVHMYSIWKTFFEQLIQDPDFHRLALHDMIGQAMVELGNQKILHVEVPEALLDLAKQILSGREGWNVVPMDGETLSARFSTEHVQWEMELEPVFAQFFTVLEQFLEERE